VLTPGDEVSVGVAVFNNLKGSGTDAKIKLSVKGSEEVEILEGAETELKIAETKETSTQVKIRAKDLLGVASLTFTASLKDKSAKLSEDISLRPATPYRTQIWGGSIKDTTAKVDITRVTYPHFAKRNVMVSFLPLSLAHGLSEFLNEFPYGCTEQLISKAMPTLLLADKADFGFKPSKSKRLPDRAGDSSAAANF